MNNELYHHGILGMKWGVRRYKNADGTLTEKGKKRYAKVAGSEKLQKRDTEDYIKIMKTMKSISDSNIEKEKNNFTVGKNFYNESLEKSKTDKDNDYSDDIDLGKTIMEFSKIEIDRWTEVSKSHEKKIKEIETGKLKAGRDFIIQRDHYLFDFTPDGVFNIYAKVNRSVSKPKEKR